MYPPLPTIKPTVIAMLLRALSRIQKTVDRIVAMYNASVCSVSDEHEPCSQWEGDLTGSLGIGMEVRKTFCVFNTLFLLPVFVIAEILNRNVLNTFPAEDASAAGETGRSDAGSTVQTAGTGSIS